ncbi:MAG: hypothetical protein BGN86_08995 [Caulobacterales bacterium 68-7]|nr:MAG: hypothetical protein BGN86_08995 [Caulobacterales bacterium 68-7]
MDAAGAPGGRDISAVKDEAASEVEGGKLTRMAAGGAFWGLTRFATEQVFRLIVFACLARLLSPSDFGIFALAVIFVDLGRILAFTGLSESLIRAESADDELSDTLFWLAIARGGAVFVSLAALSIPAARIIGQPQVAPVIVALGACLLLEAMTSIHVARATRAFRNRRLTLIALVCNFAGGAATVFAAYKGAGIWSFVVNQVVYGLLGIVLMWSAFPWAPRFRRPSRARLNEVLGFSGQVMAAQLLFVLGSRAQDFVAGRFLGPASLGQLRVGGRVFDMMYQAMIAPLAIVALPTLSRLQNDPEAFRKAFARMAALSAMITCPAMLGFAAVGTDAIPTLFGQQWAEAASVMRILSLVAPALVLGAFGGPTLMALGQGATVLRYAVLQVVTVVVASLFAVRFGLHGLAVALVVRTYLLLPVQLWIFKRASGIRPWEVLRNLIPPMGAALVMAGILLALEPWVRGLIGQPVLRLFLTVPLGVVLYGAVLALVWRGFVAEQIQAVRSVLRR